MAGLPQRENLHAIQGKTFSKVVRWEKEPFVYKAITDIDQSAPARITAAGHGVPDGWRVAVVSARGMRQINAEVDSRGLPKEREFHRATVIDVNTVDLNEVNSSGYSEYVSGGYLQFYTPASLAGCTARMTIRDRIGGTALVELTSGDGITLDDTDKTITIAIAAADVAAFDWTQAVYDLEIEDGSGVVTALIYGNFTVSPEVTT